MSGRDGMRGYLYQTLVALLDALGSQNIWDLFIIEPDEPSQKVDILWCNGNSKKAVQVKSSINQITMSQAKSWARELKSSQVADSYELLLIGPHSRELDKNTELFGVIIPPIRQLNIIEMTQQAAHCLDLYLASKNISQTPPQVRELIIGSLISKLASWSTSGAPISKTDFDYQLQTWILTAYPNSVKESAKMSCKIHSSTIIFDVKSDRLFIGSDIQLINVGTVSCIIESIVCAFDLIDEKIFYRVAMDNDKPFIGCHIPVDKSTTSRYSFISANVQHDQGRWFGIGTYKVLFFIKYQNRDSWEKVHEVSFDLTNDFIAQVRSGQAKFIQVQPDISNLLEMF